MRARLATLGLGLILAAAAAAAPLPYDEAADAKAAVQSALRTAQHSGRPVLVILGANWCEDCRALAAALAQPANARALERDFSVVKVDVGRFDRNLDLVARYGNPIAKGIPAAVVLSRTGQVLYATKAGELANARRMSASGISEFFARVRKDVVPAR